MTHTKTLATGIAALLLATPTLAEDRGYYAHFFGGISNLPTLNFSGQIGGAQQNVRTSYDTGYGLGVAVGRDIPNWSTSAFTTRGELELSYTRNDANSIDFSGNGAGAEANTSGGTSSTNLFANVLFDFKTANDRITPYAGFGAGVSYVQQDLVYGPGVRINQSDTAFAAQVIAGVSYKLTDTLDLTLDGRYSRAFGVSSNRFNPAGVSTGVVEDDVDTARVNIGLRFKF